MGKDINIHPVFDQIIQKEQKEILLKQRAKVIWFTGLSGSGKTTLAASVEQQLFKQGFLTQILDGDNIRSGINSNLTFRADDRLENIRRVAEVSKLFLNCGVIALNCFISPTEDIRDLAKEIIGRDNLIEIYVNTPMEICEKRDIKGLYQKARQGLIKNFTGIDSPYDPPANPDFTINTSDYSVEQATGKLLDFLLPQLKL